MLRLINQILGGGSRDGEGDVVPSSHPRSAKQVRTELQAAEKELRRLSKQRQALGTYVGQDDATLEDAYHTTRDRVDALSRELQTLVSS